MTRYRSADVYIRQFITLLHFSAAVAAVVVVAAADVFAATAAVTDGWLRWLPKIRPAPDRMVVVISAADHFMGHRYRKKRCSRAGSVAPRHVKDIGES